MKTLVSLFCALYFVAPLHAAGDIQGIVKNEDDMPLPNVKVQVCAMDKLVDGKWVRDHSLGWMPSFTTDQDGHFAITMHRENLRCDFYCDKPGYAPAFLRGITNHSTGVNVVLKRGITVTGTVRVKVGEKMVPLQGVPVTLQLPSTDLWYQSQAITDQNGNYTFHLTPPDNGRKWQIVFDRKAVPLDLNGGESVKGPDFETSVYPDL